MCHRTGTMVYDGSLQRSSQGISRYRIPDYYTSPQKFFSVCGIDGYIGRLGQAPRQRNPDDPHSIGQRIAVERFFRHECLPDKISDTQAINTKPLVSIIEGARPGIFTFLKVLEEKLAPIEVRWRHVSGCRRTAFNAIACVWHYRPHAHLSRQRQRAYLTALVRRQYWSKRIENFSDVQHQVYEALNQVVRASSAAEYFNGLLRPYISVKKHVSQGFLALIALYHKKTVHSAKPLCAGCNQK